MTDIPFMALCVFLSLVASVPILGVVKMIVDYRKERHDD